MWCSQELGTDMPFPTAAEVAEFLANSGKQEPPRNFWAQKMHN